MSIGIQIKMIKKEIKNFDFKVYYNLESENLEEIKKEIEKILKDYPPQSYQTTFTGIIEKNNLYTSTGQRYMNSD